MHVASSRFRSIRRAGDPGRGHLAYRSALRFNHQSVSAKLFADAEAEEKEEAQSRSKPSQADILMNKHENWDGDERIQDTVLRMLMDKYKPLRTGQIQTADEKLKASLPQVSSKPISHQPGENSGWAGLESTITHGGTFTEPDPTPSPAPTKPEPLGDPLPPWLVTFKVPSHAQASIKLGNFLSTPPRLVTSHPFAKPSSGARSRAEQKAEKRFAEGAGRLDRARDLTLDYRMGVHGQEGSGRMRPNPVSMRGWNALIEERIQHAQATGAFDKLEGRGKPFQHTADEMNPFVAREEFLMNRIVRKNDAAPPWVELQKGEHFGGLLWYCQAQALRIDAENATVQMRELLLSGWVRRAVRMLPLSYPIPTLESLTPEAAARLRDSEWERQEEKFHNAAIREANDAIRRYNTVAPYAVRRHLLAREAEMARCYAHAGDRIVAGIQEQLAGGKHVQPSQDGSTQSDPLSGIGWGLQLLRNAVKRLYARFSSVAGRHMY
ncbi:hypothetical protein FRC10_002963 [Ceratobasidium sp. 414]|nr:hypothetical protein FRC10_002963 [Ceratobasidium sp. 414]